MQTLLEKANEWLLPKGYSIMQRSVDGGWANYIPNDAQGASIQVFIKDDQMMCKASAFLDQSFIEVSTQELPLGNQNLFKQILKINIACNAYALTL